MSCGGRWAGRVAPRRQSWRRRMISKASLDLAEAGRGFTACLAAAQQHRVAVSIAIVDDAGQLLQFGRMDGARAYTVELASRKARTAAAVGIATSIITEMSRQSPGPASDAAVGAGGLPILHEQKCIGAIGISGAKPEIDDVIAVAGVSVWAWRQQKARAPKGPFACFSL